MFSRFFYYTYNYIHIHKCHLFKYILRDWLAHAQCYQLCIIIITECFDWKSFTGASIKGGRDCPPPFLGSYWHPCFIKHRLFFIACQGIGPKFRVKTINEPKMKNKFISKVNFIIFSCFFLHPNYLLKLSLFTMYSVYRNL